MSTLSIDPGTRALGWALFHGRTLASTACSRTNQRDVADQIRDHLENILGAIIDRQICEVAVEIMVIDGRQVPPQDLLRVQAVGFGVAGALGAIRAYPPNTWKGTIPKHVHHERLRAVLDPSELDVLDRALRSTVKAHRKEILDAVGIGCYHLGRTTRAGVRRRE